MPVLIELWSPSAPNFLFFERASHPLRILFVDCGYDHQNFIENLSKSKCFPELKTLDFSDYCQYYTEDWKSSCVPFEHYEQLFLAKNLSALLTFFLRNSHLSEEKVTILKSLRPQLHFARQNPRIF